MENINAYGQPSTSIDDEHGVEVQGTKTNPQTMSSPPDVPAKKRKEVESRSKVWDHFEKIIDSECKLIKGKYMYYIKRFACETKKYDTSFLRNHIHGCSRR